MTWGEGGEGGEGGEPPEDDEGPEEPEVDEEDEGPEEPEVDEEDEGPEEPEVDEEDEGPEEPEVDEEDEGPEEPEVDEEDEGPEEPEVDEEDEGPKEPEVDEEDEGPEEPEVDEEDEGPEEPEVDEEDEGPEEPEVDEEDEGPKEPELDEKEEERGERLDFDKVENGERAKEDIEEGLQEPPDKGDAAEQPDGERNEGFSENSEKKEEGEEEGKRELPDEREKKGEGTAETKREGDTNREGTKEGNSSDAEFTTSREWGGRKTPGGGWSEYYAETTHARDKRTGTTSERTSMFTRGETDQGDKVMGFGRLDGAEFLARLQNNEGWFDDFFVRIESAGVFQSVETDRPVDASLMQFPPGADVKSDLRITVDPDLRDLRGFGQSKEFWTDNDGFPTIRTTRWVIFQRESEEDKGKPPGEGGSRTSLFGYARTDEFQLRPGKDDVVNRKSSFNMFFPLEGGEGQGVGGNTASSTEGKGEEGTGGSSQGVRMLFGDRGDEGQKNDYRFKGEFTEVVYLPMDGDAGEKIESGDKTSGATSSAVVEGERASGKETAEGVVGKTGETSDAGETGEGVSVKENTTENTAAVNEADETSVVSEAGEYVPAEKETAEGSVDENSETSDAGGTKEEDVPTEENAGDAEESESKSAEGEEGEASGFVEVGENGEKVSVEDALNMIGKGIFRLGGDEAYYEKVAENGVQLDGKKLNKMLFEERKIPKEVYSVLTSLGREDNKREKSEGKQTPKTKADTEPNAGVAPKTSKKEKRKPSKKTEKTKRKPQTQKHPEEEEDEEEKELGLEDLFTIVQNTLKGIAYSISKEEFLKLYDEVVKKKGGEEKVAELLRRMKAGEAKVEHLYDMLKNNEVPLEFLGTFLEFVEGAKGVEEKVREIVQKTIKLFKRLGRDLNQQETGVQDSKVAEESGSGAASVEEELRRNGYTYLGKLIGELLNEKGLLDSWIFDLIMMRGVKEPSQSREGSEKAKDIMERFREVWERLGMNPKRKLSTIIPELYNWLERRELLLFVYNGRVDPYGRRGRVVSKIDALETLSEAVQKARGEANFLEVVNKRTGRRFFQYSVDEQLAQGRLDEEILRVAVEYAYEKREKIDGRLKLLNGNTDYILERMRKEALFFSNLEGMLKPLAELNRRLEQSDQPSTSGEQPSEKSEIPERGTASPKATPQGAPNAESEVKTAEASSDDTVKSESSDSTLEIMIQSLMKSLGLEEKLRQIYSEPEDGEESGEHVGKFLKHVFGERNLRYVLELASYGLVKSLKEGEGEVTLGEALEETVKYSRTLLEEAGETLLNENIEKLIDEEAWEIAEAAIEKFTLEALMEECNDVILERVVKMQLETGASEEKIEPLIETIKAVKQPEEGSPPVSPSATPDYKTNALNHLAEEIGTTLSDLRNYIDVPYDERKGMTRHDYYKICDALGLPPRNKKVCRVDLLRGLLKANAKLEEEPTAPGTHLSKDDLQKLLTEELRFYEMLEEEARRIYHGNMDENKEKSEIPDFKKLLEETVEELLSSEREPFGHLKFLTTKKDLLYALERWFDEYLSGVSGVTEEDLNKALQLFENLLEEAVKTLNEQRLALLSGSELNEILKGGKNKYQTDYIYGSKGFLIPLSKELGISYAKLEEIFCQRTRPERGLCFKICDVLSLSYPENLHVNGKELYVALIEAKVMMKIQENLPPKMKYLKDIVEQSDVQYSLEIFLTELIPSQLISMPRDEKGAERMRRTVEEAVEYYKVILEKTVEMLFNERIEKLSDEEIKHIINITKKMYPKERNSIRITNRKEKEKFELSALSPLAYKLNMNMTKLRNYFRRDYKNRTRLTKYDYFRILDALKLDSTVYKFRIDRKAFLKALFKGEKEVSLEEQETLSEEAKNKLFGLHWSQLPLEIHCIFFKEDRRMLMDAALRKCGNSVEKLAERLLEEMGLEYVTPHILRAFTEKSAVDVELVLALIGFIIGREPEEVIELIKGGSLAEVFKNSLSEQKLIDEGNRDWLSNLSRDVVREANLISLKEEFEKLTEATSVEQDEMNNKLFADLPRNELDKLKGAINKMRKEEGSSEKLYAYVAEKLNKQLKKEITEAKIESILRGKKRTSIVLYLLMCKIFRVEPSPELHFRSTRSSIRYQRFRVTEIDFPTPTIYTHPSGETIIIKEEGEDFFIVTGGKKLRAEKWKTQYGGKLWGISIIDYVTEEGVYGVVKETGELWLPYERPWYTHAQGRIVIGFKTAQPIRNLIKTIRKETGLNLNEISEITGIDNSVLVGKLEGEMSEEGKTITLGNLLTILGLKSTVAQTDIKKEIRQLEKEICSMGEIKISEEQKQNILYINLRTTIGASLIGHLYGDGYLRHRGRNILFSYYNSEQEYIEAVRKLLNFYGKSGNVQTKKVEEKYKEQHSVTAGGFLGYALWCAVPQAEGVKTLSNPKVPSWITDDPILAAAFLRAIISDEADVDPKEKRMRIGFSVDATRILEKRGLLHVIQNIVAERLRELLRKWDSLGLSKEELTEEQEKEERKARRVSIKQVFKEEFGEETVNEARKLPSNILIGVKEGLQTLEINSTQERVDSFYVSKTGAVTVHWTLQLHRTNARKAYELNLFEGYKKKDYERDYKKMMSRLILDNKLPREPLAELRKIQEEIGKEASEEVFLSFPAVKKHWDSNRFGDFSNIINKCIPKDIKKKKVELEKRGINAETRAVRIYFGKRKETISVEWELGWFEP